jgi:hypothetical protein
MELFIALAIAFVAIVALALIAFYVWLWRGADGARA